MINIEILKNMVMKRELRIPGEVEEFFLGMSVYENRSKRSVLKSYDNRVKKAIQDREAAGESDEDLNKLREDLASLKKMISRWMDAQSADIIKPKAIKVGKHAISQMFKEVNTPNLFNQVIADYMETTGVPQVPDKMPQTYGMVLTDKEKELMEGILMSFTETNYEGHRSITKDEDIGRRGLKKRDLRATQLINHTYSNIKDIPVIQMTQADIMRMTGGGRSKWDKIEVKRALEGLQNKRFFFYWERMVRDEKGKPILLDSPQKGRYKMEKVMSLDTIFRIDSVFDEANKLKYYEISPSVVLLDQVKNYFMLIPYGWRDEVKQVTGKRASKFTLDFLLWLRMQFEHIRANNTKPGVNREFIIKRRWEDIAMAINIPESVYKRNKARAVKIRDDAYFIAKELGYLSQVSVDGIYDVLYLNKKFYPQPGKLTNKESTSGG